MKMIRELLQNEETIWMYLDSEAECMGFYKQAYTEGYRFDDLPFDRWIPGHVVAVHKDGKMGHLPLVVWTNSWENEKWANIPGSHLPVDYSLYRSGCDDYLCKESNLRLRLIIGG